MQCLHKSCCCLYALLCGFMRFYAFLYICMRFYAFLCTSMRFDTFLCIYHDIRMRFYVIGMWFVCRCMRLYVAAVISMRFYAFLYVFSMWLLYMFIRRMNYARNMRLYLFEFRVTFDVMMTSS